MGCDIGNLEWYRLKSMKTESFKTYGIWKTLSTEALNVVDFTWKGKAVSIQVYSQFKKLEK